MAIRDSTHTGRDVRTVDPETIPGDATVRHFDQLDEDEQAALVAAVDGGAVGRSRTPRPEADVVVFTDYYEIR